MSQSTSGAAAVPPPQRTGRFRRVLKVVAAVVLGFVGLVVSCTFVLTRDVAAAGDRFLADVTGPDPAAAWREAGPILQKALPEAAFQQWVTRHNLKGGSVSFWTNRKRDNNAGSLDGTLKLQDGGSVPLHFEVRQNAAGTWQVEGVSFEPPADAAKP